MQFDRLEMTVPSGEGEYARTDAPLGDVVARLAKTGERPEPFIVFLYRPSEPESTEACDEHLLADWQAALALDRFRRYRVNVETIRREEMLGAVRTPAYVLFDPAGVEVSRVEGEKASDCDSFERTLERAWRATFEAGRKRYVTAMEKLLDEKEDIRDRRSGIEQARRELAEKPDLRKGQALDRQEQAVSEDLERVLAAERETRSGLEVREEFRREG